MFKPSFHLTIFTILAIPFISHSQSFDAGLKAGLVSSQISGDNATGFHQFGFTAGAFVIYPFSDQMSGKMEMIFIQKGSRKNMRPEKGDFYFYYLRLNYIEVPLLFRYHHNQFIFEAGPSFGYLISSLEEDENGPLPIQRPFNKFELSGNIGVTYTLNPRFDINWRYNTSIMPVREHMSGGRFWFNRGQMNEAMTITFLYYFNRNLEPRE
jgi:hypothetical protein